MKRLCIFAHYDKDNLVDEYVWYYLESLRVVSGSIVFVTTSKISQTDITRLKTICDNIIVRENTGYDFMSWQIGINSVGDIANFDELIICNDSVYGPLYSLDSIFKAMSKRGCDFWGMTDNYEIAYHIQSYFLVFKKSVIDSDGFKDFWNSVRPEGMKSKVIRRYEVGLSQSLISANFRACAYASIYPTIGRVSKARALSGFTLRHPWATLRDLRGVNPTLFFWKELIVKYRLPFVKIDLLRDNPAGVSIRGWKDIIRGHSGYNPDLIRKHLERVRREPQC